MSMEFTGERFVPTAGSEREEINIEHLHRYHTVLSLVEGKNVLDIASGEGYGTAILAAKAASVEGIDIDDNCIIHAREKYNKTIYPNLHFNKGDVSQIPSKSKSFDIVVSLETIEHVNAATQKKFLKEIKRVLTKEGIAIISTPDKENYSERYTYTNPFHANELKRTEFDKLLKTEFKNVVILEQGFDIVSLITPGFIDTVKSVRTIQWQKQDHTFKRKYLLAVISDGELPLDQLSTIVLDSGKNYFKQVDRIVELQYEVERLSAWGLELEAAKVKMKEKLSETEEKLELQSATIESEKEAKNHASAAVEVGMKKMAEEIDGLKQELATKELAYSSLQSKAASQDGIVNDLIFQLSEAEKKSKQTEWEKNDLFRKLTIEKNVSSQLEKKYLILDTHCKQAEKEFEERNILQKNMLEEQEKKINELIFLLSSANKKELVMAELAEEKRGLISGLEKEKREIELRLVEVEKNNSLHEAAISQNEWALTIQSGSIVRINEENEKSRSQISALTEKLRDKEMMVEGLLSDAAMLRRFSSELNDKLLTIYDSDGWKLLEKYYRLKGKWLPENTSRYKILKKAAHILKRKKISTPSIPKKNYKIQQESTSSDGLMDGTEIRVVPLVKNPLVSIIIPVYNGWEINKSCILSILDNTNDIPYEIIIADDCSSDETRNISKYFPNIIHIQNESNLGFLNNCNNAASSAKGTYIHFLNNDTEVKQGWLSSLIMLMESDSTIGIAGSKLIYPDGRLQEAGGIIWNDASGWNFGHSNNPEASEFNYVKETDYVSGASLLIRKNLWNDIGGFDKRYSPAYCEDSDISFEIRKRGYKVIYQPLSEVVHYEGYSHGSDSQHSQLSSIKKYQVENNKKFFEKWKMVLEKEQFPNAENVFRARDRSAGRKTLLMVDHYVPQFDKDAGSKTTFQYLQLFVKMGFNIKFLGENFYRHEPYTTVLQQMGIEVLYGPSYRDNWQQWFLENKDQFDYIYLNRPHISIQFIDFFKEHSRAKILYYGHDLHFLREQKRYELEKDDAIQDVIKKWKELEIYLFDKSNIILTPSFDEEKIISSLNPSYNVQVIRPYIYTEIKQPVKSFTMRRDILFVGGFNHTPNVDGVLWFIKEVWPVIIRNDDSINFIIAGSNPPDVICELANTRIIVKGYISDNELLSIYKSIKLVVVPLRYGAGVKGKTVEAMSQGLPMVTTEIGVEGLPGDYSFLKTAETALEFAEQVLFLYNNEQELIELSSRSVEYIHTNFSEEVAKKIIQSILEDEDIIV